jgi:hypothetical protein
MTIDRDYARKVYEQYVENQRADNEKFNALWLSFTDEEKENFFEVNINNYMEMIKSVQNMLNSV